MTQYVVRYAYVVLRYFVKKNKKNEDPRRFVNHPCCICISLSESKMYRHNKTLNFQSSLRSPASSKHRAPLFPNNSVKLILRRRNPGPTTKGIDS